MGYHHRHSRSGTSKTMNENQKPETLDDSLNAGVRMMGSSLAAVGEYIPGFSKAISLYNQKMSDRLLTKLEQGNINPNDPRLLEDRFISSFIRTKEALRKAESTEKLELLIDLFIHGIKTDSVFESPGVYHEAIRTLGEMSYREIFFVYLLDNYYRNNKKHENDNVKFREGLIKLYKMEMGLEVEGVFSMTRRLYGTGFVKVVNLIGDADYPEISPTYKDVIGIIHLHFESDYTRKQSAR